jgi:hypothetical protein
VAKEGEQGQSQPRIAGRFALVARPGLGSVVVGYAAERRSLAVIERAGGESRASYLAGEAAGEALGAGEAVDAVIDATGDLHVAWLRRADDSLWIARRRGEVWHRERIDALGGLRPSGRLAIAVWKGAPAVAFADADAGALWLLTPAEGAGWQRLAVPLPAAIDGKPARVDGVLVAHGHGALLSLAFYEPAGGDLVVVSKGAEWVASRLAGRALDGSDDGDVGRPCALTRDALGGLVVAARDRARNEVVVFHSQAGAITRRLIDDGAQPVPALALTRSVLVGTALDLQRLADGRLAVVWQDGSQARIRLAVEQPGGAFTRVELPVGDRPQLHPRLLAQVDGSLLVAWIELEDPALGGRVGSWQWVPARAEP